MAPHESGEINRTRAPRSHDSPTALNVERRRERLFWLTLIAVLMVSRAPHLVLDPRFWAEEATMYFSYARQSGVIASLLFISTGYPSYLNISANIPATIAANLAPLSVAPLVTTWWAFLIQLIPFVLVLFGNSRIWVTRPQRLLVSALLLFGPPVVTGEVWLNSTNSQVFCGIIGVILLCERTDGQTRVVVWLYRALLVFCALSGPYTIFLAPAYIVKARLEGTAEAKRHAWMVVTAVLIQAVAHVLTRVGFPYAPNRLAGGHWGVRLTTMFFNGVVYTIFGYDLGPRIAQELGILRVARQHAESIQFMRLAGWNSLLGLSAIVWSLLYRPRRSFDVVLPVALVSLLIPLYFLTAGAGSRYIVVPGTVLLLAFFSRSLNPSAKLRRRLCGLVIAVSLAAGVAAFWRDVPKVFRPLGHTRGRPSWSSEVAKWRENRHYRLRIWPYPRQTKTRFHLLRRYGPEPPAAFLEVKPFSLISKGEEVTRIVPVSGLPTDFRVVIRMKSTQPAEKTDLRLILEDPSGRRLNTTAIRGFNWHEYLWVDFGARQISLRPHTQFSDVGRIRFVLTSKADMPHRVFFERFSIGPKNVGALEHLLPSKWVRWQRFTFEHSERATIVEEPRATDIR